VEHIEQHERHIPTTEIPVREYGLNALMAIASARFTIEYG